MNIRILQLKRALYIVLIVQMLSILGTINAFAQERGLPTVTTTAVTKSGNDVVSGGNVVNDGGSPVTARGICYGNNPNPDLGSSFTHTENGTGTGVFTSVISASATGTIYVRAYATNANGTAYGEELSVNVDYYRLPRFEYNGLTYVVAPDPQSNNEFINYYDALSYCNNLTAYGYSDWTMPTHAELYMMWQNRASIGGFAQGNTYNGIFYHYLYGGQIYWISGTDFNNSYLHDNGYKVENHEGIIYTFRCHVRPVRKEIFLPTVTTDNVTGITQYNAVFGGNVTDDGGATVTERGICWSTSHNPTTSGSNGNSGTGTGNFTINVGNLTPGTEYYVRAYAINSVGTSYGNEVNFNTLPITIPTVTTNSVFDITTTTAKGGGNVINNGGSALTERGICWSTSHNPTTYNSHTTSYYNYLGSYTLNMTGLIPGTQYYVRAYATNSEGTAYGDEVSFITNSPPTVTTNTVTNITPNSATCGGNVTAEGSGAVTARGVCWSTSPNPTTNNSHTNNGTGTGSFTSTLTGLNQGTLYYVRAYATNSEGTAYGDEVSFTTICTHSVTTNNVSYITQTSAICGGYVTVYNGTTVTRRGVCWSTSNQSPTLSDSHTSNGSGTGSFTSNLTGLTPGTGYYVRAYATSNEGTVYGETKLFATTEFEYRISEGGVVGTSAGGYFYDSGGPDEEYDNNEQYIMTFMSNQGAGTKIQMTFTEFYTAGYWGDYLVIYDGMNTSAPMIGTYGYGYGNSPGTITATNSDGALTFVWISDDWYTNTGWKAAISIVGQSYSYTINTTANPSYGGTVSGGGYYNSGESCTVTAQANDGYVFTNWTENGNVVSTNASYTFTVNSNRSLVANFQAQPQSFTINVSANPTNGGTAAGGGTYNQGTSCTVTATANAGYTFTNWTENGNVVSTQANYTFQVNNNRSLVANFVEVGGDNCNIVFDLMDSYGDGWNGNKLNVAFSDGSPSQELTFTTGYNASYMIGVNDGVYVTLSWTQGSYISECSFRVRYEIGPQIYYGSNLNSSFSYIFQMDCSSSNNNIAFADANVKALCVANWDTSGDGELSYAEAAAVTNLGQVFQNNTGITYFNELQYFVGLTSIGSNAFYGCSALASVSIPNSVTYFGGNAFTNCSSLTSITLPNSLTSIGNNAFFGCTGLTSIIIPSSVTSLGTEVFRDCPGLAQMSVRSGNPVYDSRSYCNAIIKTATNELVYGCKNTVIPNSVTSIGGAFDGCTSLISIEIPSSVTSIGSYAFYNCTSLTTMTVLAETPPTLGSSVFHNVNKSIPVYVPCGSIEAYQSATSWSEFTNYQGIDCTNLQVRAQYYPDVNDPCSSYVNVYWGTTTSLGEAFESGDFSVIDWMLDPTYPWCITTHNPYEGTYCMKSGGVGVANVTSNMTVTVNIPADGEMSFFGKISCEANYDKGHFFIDGMEMATYTGSGSWGERTFPITAGDHIFQWRYTKDSSVNSNDDCFYVDNITFYRTPAPASPGWHTYCEAEFDNAYHSTVGNCSWGYQYPASMMAQYAGFQLTKVSVFSDDLYGAVGGNFTCNVYVGGNTPAGGTLASTLTVDVPCNQGDWVEYNLTTPVSVTGTEPIWVLWSENVAGCLGYPAGCSTGSNEYGNWWNNGQDGWTHQSGVIWTMKNYFTNNRGSSVELGFTDSAPFDVEKSQGNNRTYEYFRIYRAQCDGSGTTLIADNLAQHYYFDIEWLYLNPGIYKYGVYALDGNTTDIVWSNCIEKLASYQIAATANPTEGGIVTGGGTYIQGASCTLTATAYSGYTFANWTENGTVVSTSASYSFTVVGNRNLAANFSANAQNYSISVSASPSTGGTVTGGGSYAQGAICNVTAMANSGYTFTNWTENDEVVSTNTNYSFTVSGNRNLVANFSSNGNHWNVDIHQYPNNMAITGIVQIDGVEQTNPALEIGAFCNGECRGAQRLTYYSQVDRYLVFLMIYGEEGDLVNFKLYNHETGEEKSNCYSLVTFIANNALGSSFNPYAFDFNNMQPTQFSEGWNWWSTYIEQNGIDGLSLLENSLGTKGITIKSQSDGYTEYYDDYGIWYGSLNSIDNESFYMVKTSTSCTVNLAGNTALPSQHPITVDANGWTWIGYSVAYSMDINAALGNLSAIDGDMLKSQSGYAEFYDGYGWFGTLETLSPSMGYMYKSNNDSPATFTYPDNGRTVMRDNITAKDNHWVPTVSAYPFNMTVTAVVELDGEELRSDRYELAAFANGESRGSVRLMYVEPIDRYVAFLTIAGEEAADLSLSLYDTETSLEYFGANETLGFEANATLGRLAEPFVVSFRGTTGMDELANSLRVYPNPVNAGERFSIGMNAECKAPVRVEIVNALGITVSVETSTQAPASIVAPVTAGVYTLRVTVDGKGTAVRKLVVK